MKRNAALDGLRGYAALIVVFYHVILGLDEGLIGRVLYTPIQQIAWGYDKATKVALSVFNGEIAVILFFILSGTVLFQGLQRFSQKNFLVVIVAFCIKRSFRIYPALITCMILFFVSRSMCQYMWPDALPEVYSLSIWIQNTFLRIFTIHGASWTLKVEMLAIPFILLVNYAYRFIGVTALFIFLVYSLAARFYPVLTFDWSFVNDNLPYFALGFLIPTEFGRRLFVSLRSLKCMFLIGFLISIKLFMYGESIFTIYCQAFISFLLVGRIYHDSSQYCCIFLEKKYSQFLGKISYSFYLLNVIFLKLIQGWMLMLGFSTLRYVEWGLLIGISIVFLTIPIAILSQRYIEQPFIKMGEKMISYIVSALRVLRRDVAWQSNSEVV